MAPTRPVCPLPLDAVKVNGPVLVGAPAIVRTDTPATPSIIARIVAVPEPRAVTKPMADTVARVVSLDDHVTKRPASTMPVASRGTALSISVAPSSSVAAAGVTTTVAGGAGTT